MEDDVPKVRDSCLLPKSYGGPTTKTIVVCFNGEHELESDRYTHEPVSNFIEILQRIARENGVITDDDRILTLEMATDGTDPEGIDHEGTVGDILEHLGDRDLQAVLESTKAAPAPAIQDHLPLEANASPGDVGVEHSQSKSQDQPGNIASAFALQPSARPPPACAPSGDRADNPVVLLPQRAQKVGRGPQPRPAPISVTFDHLRQLFDLPRYAASRQLGLSSGDVYFKRMMTDFGLMTWPYRSKRSLESSIEGLEYAIDKGGYGADIDELRAVVAAAKKSHDMFRTGSAAVINALVFPPQPIFPKKVRNFLTQSVGWRARENRRTSRQGPNGNRNDAAEDASPLVAKSGSPGAGKRKADSDSNVRSSKRLKRQSKGTAMKRKRESDASDSAKSDAFAEREDGAEEESEYEPTRHSDAGSL